MIVCQELSSSTKKNTHTYSLTGGVNHHRNDCLASNFEKESKDFRTNSGCTVAGMHNFDQLSMLNYPYCVITVLSDKRKFKDSTMWFFILLKAKGTKGL